MIMRLAILILLALPSGSYATERVNVDLTKLGPPLQHRASGFLHSIELKSPADDLIAPLRPRLFRDRPEGKESGAFPLYNRMTRMGAAIQVVLSDGYTNYKPPFPGDGGDWSRWELQVTNHIRKAASAKMDVQWDLWNEPDHEYFWKPSTEQFLETWKRTYRLVRKLDPRSTIVGPSLSNRKSKRLSLEQFLLYAKNNGCLPDVLSWHQWSGNVVESVAEVKQFMSDNGIRIERISLNEIVSAKHFMLPGILPRYFAEIERASVESAAHACWQEPSGVANCDNASLDGLLTHDTKQPRAAWHVYAAYGRMSGRVATVTRSATVDAIATVDAERIYVLMGRFRVSKEQIELTLSDLTNIARAGKVHVRIERIADTGLEAMKSPMAAADEDRASQDPIVLKEFAGHDAWLITLSRPRL
jgi:hypothetical protein